MEQVLLKRSPKEEARREYRLAFQNFCAKARNVRLVTSELNADPAALAAALLVLEQARVAHNNSRDALGYLLLESSMQFSSRSVPLSRRSLADKVDLNRLAVLAV